MASNKNMQVEKDLANKKFTITRYYDAEPSLVWKAWTTSELLEQWWAPRPWRAETKEMKFKEGGHWHYAMVGPDQDRQWCKVEFIKINAEKSFEVKNFFCDESGAPAADPMLSLWRNEFHPSGKGTKLVVEITAATKAPLEKMLELGFEQGFGMALGNLEEVLAGQVKK